MVLHSVSLVAYKSTINIVYLFQTCNLLSDILLGEEIHVLITLVKLVCSSMHALDIKSGILVNLSKVSLKTVIEFNFIYFFSASYLKSFRQGNN